MQHNNTNIVLKDEISLLYFIDLNIFMELTPVQNTPTQFLSPQRCIIIVNVDEYWW